MITIVILLSQRVIISLYFHSLLWKTTCSRIWEDSCCHKAPFSCTSFESYQEQALPCLFCNNVLVLLLCQGTHTKTLFKKILLSCNKNYFAIACCRSIYSWLTSLEAVPYVLSEPWKWTGWMSQSHLSPCNQKKNSRSLTWKAGRSSAKQSD